MLVAAPSKSPPVLPTAVSSKHTATVSGATQKTPLVDTTAARRLAAYQGLVLAKLRDMEDLQNDLQEFGDVTDTGATDEASLRRSCRVTCVRQRLQQATYAHGNAGQLFSSTARTLAYVNQVPGKVIVIVAKYTALSAAWNTKAAEAVAAIADGVASIVTQAQNPWRGADGVAPTVPAWAASAMFALAQTAEEREADKKMKQDRVARLAATQTSMLDHLDALKAATASESDQDMQDDWRMQKARLQAQKRQQAIDGLAKLRQAQADLAASKGRENEMLLRNLTLESRIRELEQEIAFIDDMASGESIYKEVASLLQSTGGYLTVDELDPKASGYLHVEPRSGPRSVEPDPRPSGASGSGAVGASVSGAVGTSVSGAVGGPETSRPAGERAVSRAAPVQKPQVPSTSAEAHVIGGRRGDPPSLVPGHGRLAGAQSAKLKEEEALMKSAYQASVKTTAAPLSDLRAALARIEQLEQEKELLQSAVDRNQGWEERQRQRDAREHRVDLHRDPSKNIAPTVDRAMRQRADPTRASGAGESVEGEDESVLDIPTIDARMMRMNEERIQRLQTKRKPAFVSRGIREARPSLEAILAIGRTSSTHKRDAAGQGPGQALRRRSTTRLAGVDRAALPRTSAGDIDMDELGAQQRRERRVVIAEAWIKEKRPSGAVSLEKARSTFLQHHLGRHPHLKMILGHAMTDAERLDILETMRRFEGNADNVKARSKEACDARAHFDEQVKVLETKQAELASATEAVARAHDSLRESLTQRADLEETAIDVDVDLPTLPAQGVGPGESDAAAAGLTLLQQLERTSDRELEMVRSLPATVDV